ncbi:MAG: CehA/McbA family metallohydrolase [Verrucomicrobiae bacterium]|nr:CehA/McbA family metallohydrolase [Verrucomicrobiae bacterium]
MNSGEEVVVRFLMKRFFNPSEYGWVCGDNHVHPQHDPAATIKADDSYAIVQALGNGLDFLTINAKSSSPIIQKSKSIVVTHTPEIGFGMFTGHFNVIGASEFKKEPGILPAQKLVAEVHARGGAVVYTHPLHPPTQLHHMGATEAFSDAVLGRCADAFDVHNRQEEALWFMLLNLGNRMAVSSSTDATLERPQTHAPGDYRVYVQAKSPTWKQIAGAVRQGRTFATNGGPVYVFFDIDGKLPGARIPTAPDKKHLATIQVASRFPLKSLEIIRNGQVIKRFQKGSKGMRRFSWKFKEGEKAWYVARVEDQNSNWAISSPVYLMPRKRQRRLPSAFVLLEIGNFIGRCQLSRRFCAHVMVTTYGSCIGKVEVRRNDRLIRAKIPADGNQMVDGQIPVTGIPGREYKEGWGWHPHEGRANHFQMDLPIEESGWYQILAYAKDGRVIKSDRVYFDSAFPKSQQMTSANLFAGNHRFSLRGYGEDTPLNEISSAILDLKKHQWTPRHDHWWFPHKACWEIKAVFDGQVAYHEFVDGLPPSAQFHMQPTSPRRRTKRNEIHLRRFQPG